MTHISRRTLGMGAAAAASLSAPAIAQTAPRSYVLTTATTVAGLLPLAFTQSTLWPPMAWAIISGLLASTMLTLLVVPALCLLTFRAPEATRAV